YGLIGGALGFGLGSLWMVAGSRYDTIFTDYWKGMEFSFGFLLGGALGLAAWKSQDAIDKIKSTTFTKVGDETMTIVREMVLLSILAIVIHAIVPYSLDPVVDSLNRSYSDGFWTALLRDLLRLVVGYGF